MTVVVPCCNYGRFLRDAVLSVLSQEAVDVDVIIVDDASTDDTPDVSRQLAAGDPRVRVIRHQQNQGHIATFNEGMFAAEGDFVVKLDADDMLTPGSLARSTALFEAHPSVALVYGHPVHFTAPSPPAARVVASSWTIWSGDDWLRERFRTTYNCISNPEAIARTTVLHEVGGNRPELPATFDMELWMRLATVADIGLVNGADQGYYRVHPDSFQRTIHSGFLHDARQRLEAFLFILRDAPKKPPDALELEEHVRLTIAVQALERACQAYDRGRSEGDPPAELMAFAVEIYPAAHTLREWRRLQGRLRIDPKRAPFVPHFFGHALYRRLKHDAYMRRWKRSGL